MNEPTEFTGKMRALTEKQRNFVWAMVTQPGLPQWKYAELAGYEGGPTVTKVKACYLLQDEKVLDALLECASRRMRSHSLVATEVLVDVATNEKASFKDRIRASEALLDRVGLGGQQNIKVEHTHTDMTGAAMMERIRELAKRHGMDPDKLLAGKATLPSVSRETLPQAVVIEGKAEAHDDILGSAQETEAATKDLP